MSPSISFKLEFMNSIILDEFDRCDWYLGLNLTGENWNLIGFIILCLKSKYSKSLGISKFEKLSNGLCSILGNIYVKSQFFSPTSSI